MAVALAFSIMQQETPQACLVDLTPPTFAGIVSLLAKTNGALAASWAAATDDSEPIRYRVFIKKATATGLFDPGNIALETQKLSVDLFFDALGDVLEYGVTYYVGVRAVDQPGNEDSNSVSLSATSEGVISSEISGILNKIEALVATTCQTLEGSVTDSDTVLEGQVEESSDLEGEVNNC